MMQALPNEAQVVSTIIVALRSLQAAKSAEEVKSWLLTDEEPDLLTDEEIDALCEQLNHRGIGLAVVDTSGCELCGKPYGSHSYRILLADKKAFGCVCEDCYQESKRLHTKPILPNYEKT